MISLGSAVGLPLAIDAAEDVELRRPLDVVADQQVQKAVAVEIEPERGSAEALPPTQSGFLGDVHEVSRSGVLKQAVLADGGNQDIGEAIVIEVRHGHAHAVHFDCQAGTFGDVAESSVAIVAIQFQGAALALVTRPVHSIDQQNVQPTVAVVIQKGAAGTHGLGQILGAKSAAIVVEVDARGCGDVGERKAQSGRCRSRRPAQARHSAAEQLPPRHAMLTKPWRMA